MEVQKPTNQERYVAASGYLFELGYIMAWLMQTESDFTKFHLEQENKIIKAVLLPGLSVFFLGILWQSTASKFLIYLGGFTAVVSLVLSVIGAWHALKGKQKKLI